MCSASETSERRDSSNCSWRSKEAGATPQSDAEAPHPLPDDEGDEETETLDPDAFVGGLTEHDVAILGAWSRGELDSLPRLLLRRRLPLIPEQTYVADLRLHPRTAGAITRRGHEHVGEWLRVATIRDILLLPNFGRSSMRDLLDGIVRLMLQPPLSEHVTALANEIAAHDLAGEFTGYDPRFRSVAAGFCQPSETLRDAGVRLADRVRDPVDHVGIVADLRVVITELERVRSQRLEDEMLEICVSVSNERNGAITTRYRGWDGRGGAVLQEVGDEVGMTRERVRQICVKVEKRLRAMNPAAPVLKRVLNEIAERAPMWSDDLPAVLQEAGLASGTFRAQALVVAAELLGLATAVRVEIVDGRERVTLLDDDSSTELEQLIRLVRRIGRRTVEHWGVGRIQDVARLAEKEHGQDVDESFVRDLLSEAEGFRWLDQVRGWYWNADVPRNRLTNQIDKVLSVAKALPVSELRVAVSRNYRMEGQAPPLDILAEFCRQLPNRVVEGDVVRADPPLDPVEILAETELLFYRTLKANGSLMSRADLEDACRQQGMNRVTFYIYLGNSAILVCPRRGVYALVGSDYTDDQLASLVDRRSRRGRVLVAAGRHSQTCMWTVYCLSENMVSSGVFNVSNTMKPLLAGAYDLWTDAGVAVGTITAREVGSGGLGHFFRYAKAQPGQYLALVFDVESREARVTLGDETLVNQFLTDRSKLEADPEDDDLDGDDLPEGQARD